MANREYVITDTRLKPQIEIAPTSGSAGVIALGAALNLAGGIRQIEFGVVDSPKLKILTGDAGLFGGISGGAALLIFHQREAERDGRFSMVVGPAERPVIDAFAEGRITTGWAFGGWVGGDIEAHLNMTTLGFGEHRFLLTQNRIAAEAFAGLGHTAIMGNLSRASAMAARAAQIEGIGKISSISATAARINFELGLSSSFAGYYNAPREARALFFAIDASVKAEAAIGGVHLIGRGLEHVIGRVPGGAISWQALDAIEA